MYIFKKPSLSESCWHFLCHTHIASLSISYRWQLTKLLMPKPTRTTEVSGISNWLGNIKWLCSSNDRVSPVWFDDDACQRSGWILPGAAYYNAKKYCQESLVVNMTRITLFLINRKGFYQNRGISRSLINTAEKDVFHQVVPNTLNYSAKTTKGLFDMTSSLLFSLNQLFQPRNSSTMK